jgi:hypothetical protein
MCITVLLTMLAASVVTKTPIGDGCVDALGCSLNGECENGVCVCDGGWEGDDCHLLKLSPAFAPPDQAYCHYNDSTWGGSVLKGDDGVYHMYFSEMANNCTLHDYGSVSRVVHATARSPLGPFVRQSIALPVFAHNPQVIRHPDGTLLLFHIGDTVDPACVSDCRPNTTTPSITTYRNATSTGWHMSNETNAVSGKHDSNVSYFTNVSSVLSCEAIADAHNASIFTWCDAECGQEYALTCALRFDQVVSTKSQPHHTAGFKGATAPPTPAPDPCRPKSHAASIAFSSSPYGPWTRLPYAIGGDYTNPGELSML